MPPPNSEHQNSKPAAKAQDAPGCASGGCAYGDSYRLSGGTIQTSGASMTLRITLSEADLVYIKSSLELGKSSDYLFMYADTGLLSDGSGNPSKAISSTNALQVGTLLTDIVIGAVQSFSVNMGERIFTLIFNEVINVDSFRPDQVSIQDRRDASTDGMSYQLTSSSTDSASLDGFTVVIHLSNDDLVNIGKTHDLATARTDTFIRMRPSAFEDVSGRYIEAITVDKALQANEYIPDTTAPFVNAGSLDLTAEKLQLNFSEPINTSSLLADDIRIHMVLSSDTRINEPRTGLAVADGGISFTSDAQTVEIELASWELNQIKIAAYETLPRNASSVYISTTKSLVVDLFAVPAVNSTLEMSFTSDRIAPTLNSFDLNANDGILTLYFSEAVQWDSVNQSGITLQSHRNGSVGATYTLSGGMVSKSHAYVIIIKLTVIDDDGIKRRGIGSRRGTTFLAVTGGAARDMNSNALVTISSDNGILVDNFQADTSVPVAQSINVDMDRGVILIECTETIEMESVRPSLFTFFGYNSTRADASGGYKLSGGTVRQVDSKLIRINMTRYDLDQIKDDSSIFTNEDNTFIWFALGTFQDMSGNNVTESNVAMQVSQGGYTPDTTAPILMGFDFDANMGMFNLTFTETVNHSAFSAIAITVQRSRNLSNDCSNCQLVIKLEPSYLERVKPNALSFEVDEIDLHRIQFLEHLGINKTTTFISFSSDLIEDNAGNSIVAVTNTSALPVSEFINDITRPEIISAELNVNTRTLILKYSEIIRISDSKPALIGVRGNGTARIFFERSAVGSSSNGLVVQIDIDVDDMNAMKAIPSVGSSPASIIVHKDGAVADMVGNDILQQEFVVTHYVPDEVGPQLARFECDLTKQVITL